jgi:protein-S-isoprenylcysteine O-methyltransferase Ste14
MSEMWGFVSSVGRFTATVMITYDTIMLLSWAAFLLVWGVSAFFVKRDVRGGGYAALWQRYWVLRLAAAALIIIVAVRLGRRAGSSGAVFLSLGIFTPPLALRWAGAALTAIGISFAIWARIYLGRNWSPRPAVKEQHEFVTTGPYAYVRHPIYAGVILAALGSALTGSIFGIGMFVIISTMFALRINKEEQIMCKLFPSQYPEYQKHTKRLVPFVW